MQAVVETLLNGLLKQAISSTLNSQISASEWFKICVSCNDAMWQLLLLID